MDENTYRAILDAYPYEIVYADREHVVRWMNQAAKRRYQGRLEIGQSLFSCHNESSCGKIKAFLARADAGEEEMYEASNTIRGEREFFVPVRNDAGFVIGYFERHELCWDMADPAEPVGEYWKRDYKGAKEA